jgi:hypothetical protein
MQHLDARTRHLAIREKAKSGKQNHGAHLSGAAPIMINAHARAATAAARSQLKLSVSADSSLVSHHSERASAREKASPFSSQLIDSGDN